MRISDLSSDVCSSDLRRAGPRARTAGGRQMISSIRSMAVACVLVLGLGLAPVHDAAAQVSTNTAPLEFKDAAEEARFHDLTSELRCVMCQNQSLADSDAQIAHDLRRRSEEHTTEPQSLMR